VSDEVIKYLKLLSNIIANLKGSCDLRLSYYDKILKLMAKELHYALDNLKYRHYADFMRNLKVILESAIILTYYFTKYRHQEEYLLKEVHRRSRAATTFNIKMIGKIKGLHGIIKKEIINAYLKVSEYSHPTNGLSRIHEDTLKYLSEMYKLVNEVVDYVIYLFLLLCRDGVKKFKDAVVALNLRRSGKYIRRH